MISSQPLSMRVPAILIAIAFTLASCGGKRARIARPPRIGTTESGIASWYGPPYHGRRAANGEVYDMERFTAAHRTFAFNTWVRVRNLDNKKEVDVRITDRGPFVRGRIIDLSKAAARHIDLLGPGIAKVKLTVIDPRHAINYGPPTAPSPDAPRQAAAPPPPIVGPIEPPPPPPPLTEESYGVQVGAFRDRDRAGQLRLSLEQRMGYAHLLLRDTQIPTWRVVVGRYSDLETAETAAGLLRSEFPEAFVVRRDVPLQP
ncbi:MAG: septal ring lytic transglycosylase RlpA family protein [Bryobacterales bacterium]|nr:septal ring lytic transglycosylase RlpA family protein [Bryobacterales bacterium]